VVGRTSFGSLLAPESRRRCFAKVNTGSVVEESRDVAKPPANSPKRK
jgi:hypothetical protein